MKKGILIASIFACSMNVFGQNKSAQSCGSGCYFVTASTKSSEQCTDKSGRSYTISNKTIESLDIQLYVEKKQGGWESLGLFNDVAAGKVLTDATWSCGATGRYILYYRKSGSTDKFPSNSDVTSYAR